IDIEKAFGKEERNAASYSSYAYNIHITVVEMMQVIGCVYDWCYPLLTARDKKQLVGAATSKCASKMEFPKYPPDKTGGITGHQSGPTFLEGWMPFVLAIYDEYPEYYNVIFDLIEHVVVPGQNHLLSAGYHLQGVSYGASRLSSLLAGECWYSYMFDNREHLFSEKVHDVILAFLKSIRPDGEPMRIGDDFFQGRRFCHLIVCALLGSGLYKDPILKGFAAKETDDFSLFWLHKLNPIEVLLFNDARVPKAPLADLPLVSYFGNPAGVILAKSAHDSKNAGMVYMKIGSCGSANHEHRDCGDFQIYYKGMLLGSSGTYSGYGCAHDYGYYKQTISKNSILVYNPSMKDNGKWKYSGGQRIDAEAVKGHINNLEEWKQSPNYNHARLLYGGYKTVKKEGGKEEYRYSYIAGDITNAYDRETVSEVKRHMVSFMTDNKVNPMVFVIFDKITSVDAGYKKSLLFHTQNQPLTKEVNGKPCSVVTNLMSRLYIQSLFTEVEHTFVGGKDRECWVVDQNVPFDFPGRVEGALVAYNAESGFGRIEISPKEASKENTFLTVMYVGPHTDCSPYLNLDTNILQPYREAIALESDTVLGTAILDHAVIFAKNGEYITNDFSVEIPTNTKKCLVFGLCAGKWQTADGKKYTVSKNEAMAEIETDGQSKLQMHFVKQEVSNG
ncbi:MAG: heparinase II/III family protein, partial [Clostridia bacterium]|nr:heparinase II/III family protein [Clostridia bacterium]